MEALLHIDGDPAPSIHKTGGPGIFPFLCFLSPVLGVDCFYALLSFRLALTPFLYEKMVIFSWKIKPSPSVMQSDSEASVELNPSLLPINRPFTNAPGDGADELKLLNTKKDGKTHFPLLLCVIPLKTPCMEK